MDTLEKKTRDGKCAFKNLGFLGFLKNLDFKKSNLKFKILGFVVCLKSTNSGSLEVKRRLWESDLRNVTRKWDFTFVKFEKF